MAAKNIYEAVLALKHKSIADLVEKEINSGTDFLKILNEGLIPAMDELGRLYTEGTLFVPEMLAGAMTMKNGLAVLKPFLAQSNSQPAGVIVIGTVKGDQHDVGKNLVSMILEGGGFKVVDIGVDNDTSSFVKAIEAHQADIAALSSLLTTSMPSMERIIKELKSAVAGIKTMVGGAPVSIEFAEKIGSHGYGQDGPSAVKTARRLMAEYAVL